ncbi:MAG TPA: GNAT family N-acetyltransferase [Solirubrobacterales bacterium]|nr:GNAT family N-acetyltransferase [Solirubrobacterales bacterium]
MSEAAALTERYDPTGHKVANFACGEESLDRWLHRYAGQSERRDATRTFVAADEHRVVHGYYTLVAGQLEHAAATESVRKSLSRHFPIPVAILARLAVDKRSQGQGLGASLLNDAFERICRAAQEVAVRAVVVHAIDETAADFYERFGFRSLSTAPRTLMVTLAELRSAGYLSTTLGIDVANPD